jgi:hypothetical protein
MAFALFVTKNKIIQQKYKTQPKRKLKKAMVMKLIITILWSSSICKLQAYWLREKRMEKKFKKTQIGVFRVIKELV